MSTWREVVEKDCQVHKLNKKDAMDRSRWRKLIKDVCDWDGCEWVNVSSGTWYKVKLLNVYSIWNCVLIR